jgi:endothelin-converting enzyme
MNEIVFPAAILQSPFFDANAPGSLNYGAIGSIVGHEITHGFDNHGRLFDGRGVLVSWWSNHSAEAFDNKAKCFVNQYNDYEVSKGNHVNGQLTLGENLADNGGLYVAWKAWQRGRSDPNTRLKEFKLPGLLDWTPEQMFFVSYAQNWCANVRPEEALRRLMVDPHAPNEFRVQGPLVNSREFATAYKCPLGSPMNPQQKCQVW